MAHRTETTPIVRGPRPARPSAQFLAGMALGTACDPRCWRQLSRHQARNQVTLDMNRSPGQHPGRATNAFLANRRGGSTPQLFRPTASRNDGIAFFADPPACPGKARQDIITEGQGDGCRGVYSFRDPDGPPQGRISPARPVKHGLRGN